MLSPHIQREILRIDQLGEAGVEILIFLCGLYKTEEWDDRTFIAGLINIYQQLMDAPFSHINRKVGYVMRATLSANVSAILERVNEADRTRKNGEIHQTLMALSRAAKKGKLEQLMGLVAKASSVQFTCVVDGISLTENFVTVIAVTSDGRTMKIVGQRITFSVED